MASSSALSTNLGGYQISSEKSIKGLLKATKFSVRDIQPS